MSIVGTEVMLAFCVAAAPVFKSNRASEKPVVADAVVVKVKRVASAPKAADHAN